MMRAVIGALACSVWATVVGASAAVSEPHPASTQIRLVLPFTAPGTLGLTVSAHVTGTCFAGSAADSGRPDAWRCMSGNRIYDPCFAGYLAAKTVVACLSSPTAAAAVVLTPAGGVPLQEANKKDLLTSLPWSLDLVNGARCAVLTGATAAFAGMRVNYGCTNRGSVIGEVDRSPLRWRVFYQAPNATTASLVDVVTAWY
jgi:hypothetical protein